MAKLAKDEGKKDFSPIAQKLIDTISAPVPVDLHDTKAKVVSIPERSNTAVQEEPPVSERLTKQMRYGATPTEEREMKEFLTRISTATGLSVTHSNLMRSARDLLYQVEERLITEIRQANLRRPINDSHAIARYEARLTDIMRTAIRQSPLSYSRNSSEP
jgi:hypothetical protein